MKHLVWAWTSEDTQGMWRCIIDQASLCSVNITEVWIERQGELLIPYSSDSLFHPHWVDESFSPASILTGMKQLESLLQTPFPAPSLGPT